MAGKGGARPGAGRKPKPAKPAAVSKGAADEILDFLALEVNPHGNKVGKDGKPLCRCLKCRWRALSDAFDMRLRYQVEKSLLDRVLGLPAQAVEHKGDINIGVELMARLAAGRKRAAGGE